MVERVVDPRTRRILDPALGPGVFVQAVMQRLAAASVPANVAIEACEIDPAMIAAFERSCTAARPVRVHRGDFLRAAFEAPFDAIVCNPPYVRHHELELSDDVLAIFDRQIGRRLPRLTNLYGLFLLRIWTLLGPGGRAAIITPAEWLNADFGVALKAYLLAENALDELIQFAPGAAVFDGVLTTAAITVLRRDRPAGAPIRLRMLHSAAELTALDAGRNTAPHELDPQAKWSPLFERDDWPGPAPRGRPLGTLARCVRGIATGANSFFVLRPSEAERWRIDRRDLRPCISKAALVRHERLTPSDIERLIDDDERVLLLDPREPPTPAVLAYLTHGRALGVDQRYLPAHRPVWYQPERRPPAPIWINVFARDGFRFVRNEACALHLTAFHAIYPLPGIDADQLHAALLSAAREGALTEQQRHYAAGLRKLEPRDVERVVIPASAPVVRPSEVR